MVKINTTRIICFSRTFWTICLVFVIAGSLLPGSSPILAITASDKLLHLIAYAVLAALRTISLPTGRAAARWAVYLICLGILLEMIQGLVPNRMPSLWDGLANTVGVTLGVVIGIAARRWLLKSNPA